ncbi:hypothetical protein F441_13843 [Phytophthora nicotianae CJ01A1]|uniref:Uncharacterized protein n=2 Tax=Phytophthora nicotianae TaxID=4792 RepID=W2GD64_PHYNI|nr:hypothetical protein L915_13551 [Phytophthora nicotianae]ETL34304.1 hypothetical protein L916_13450 [Phytophthora nicotianae]ETP10548.1 hypothetical protein F441_13843 [Phytophthora nicotianae CJ01A1]
MPQPKGGRRIVLQALTLLTIADVEVEGVEFLVTTPESGFVQAKRKCCEVDLSLDMEWE